MGPGTDWLSTAQTVAPSVIGQAQFNQTAGYEAKQALPYAKDSPAALAQLGLISQRMGGPAAMAGESQKQNYAAIAGYIDKAAGSASQYNSNMNNATIAMAKIGRASCRE